MSFPKYPEYKDSGVEWLGEVPKHWRLKKIAWHVPYTVGWTPSSGKEEYYDGDNLWVTIADLNKPVIHDTKSKISDTAVSDRGGRLSPAGSMLFSFKLTVGNVAFLGKPAYTNEAIASFEPNQHVDLSYWSYAAPLFIPKYGRENIYGALLLNQELIGAVRFYAPDVQEQMYISRFLDHETARIDALVEQQQRLIELLKEKRQAVISHAVTKGLDPNVPMKDSGVEWLGEVPAHWTVGRVKNLVEFVIDGPHFSPAYVEEGVIFLSARNIKIDRWSFSDAKFISQDDYEEFSKRVRPRRGDVLLTKGGTTGIARAVDFDEDFQVWVHIAVLRPIKFSIDPAYLAYALNSKACYEQSQLYTRGATNNDLGLTRIVNIVLSWPSLSEQQAVVNYLDKIVSRLDAASDSASDTISLLQERRSALISAAVTGKIDVRGWTPPADAASVDQEPRMEAV